MKIVKMKLGDVKPYFRNPRNIGPDAVAAVAASLREYGQQIPLVVDRNNVIVTGHVRYKAMLEIGWEQCDVIVTDLPEDKIRGYRVIDNKTSEKATWNDTVLMAELRAFTDLSVFQPYFPELKLPDLSVDYGRTVTSGDVAEAQQSLETQFASAAQARADAIHMITCPHCSEKFEITG